MPDGRENMQDPSSSAAEGPLSTTRPLRPRRTIQDQSLINNLADEMIQRWGQGEQLQAEELLNRHPELWDQPEAAIELVYEEICQRRQQGQADFAEAVLAR